MIINFSMDFLALYITARLMHIRIRPKRITLGAIVGAVYSLAVIFFGIDGISGAFTSIVAAFLLAFVSYKNKNFTDLSKNTAVFYGVSFALGGGITAICNLLNIWQNSRNVSINGTFDIIYGDLPFEMLLLTAASCGVFSLIAGRVAKNKRAKKECELEIRMNKNSVTLTALVDSGNLLKEPISEKPVIIASYEKIRAVIPVEMLEFFKTKELKISEQSEYSARLRIIPSTSAAGHRLFYGLFPDSVKINGKEVDAYVAVDDDTADYSGFSAIVPEILV